MDNLSGCLMLSDDGNLLTWGHGMQINDAIMSEISYILL